MPDKPHIFLSYRSAEKEFALRLARDLLQKNIPIWMDQLQGILPGDDWIQTLQDALNNSSGLIAVISPKYILSKYCRNELKRVAGLGRPVIPVLLEEVPKDDWPYEIQTNQYADFRQWQDPDQYSINMEKLLAGLEKQLGVKAGVIPAGNVIPEPGPALRGRDLDEQAQQAVQRAEKLKSGSEFLALKVGFLKKAMEMAMARWAAANDQRLSTLNEADKPPLEAQMKRFEQEILKYQADLQQLKG